MGKKKKSVLDAEYVGFEAGMATNGFSPAAVKTLWDILVPFADYAFNKAHSAAYGLISYWTAFLKANYPAEYMAALLTSVGDDKDKRPIYLAECRRMGIKVCPPTSTSPRRTSPPSAPTSASAWPRSATSGTSWRRSSGRGRVRARSRTSPTSSQIDAVACNKKVIESLCKAGRFDSLGHSRQGLVTVHANAVDMAMSLKRKEAEGQFDLFGASVVTGRRRSVRRGARHRDPHRGLVEVERLVFEQDMLGLYVSDHPLHGVEHVLTSHADTAIAEINAGGVDGANVTIAGILTAVGPRTNKQGAPWAIATLEDLESGIEVLLLPEDLGRVLRQGGPRPDRRDQGADQPPGRPAVPVRLRGPRSGDLRRPARAGARLDARRALHAAGGGAAP